MAWSVDCPKCGFPIILTRDMQRPIGPPVPVIPVSFDGSKLVEDKTRKAEQWQWIEFDVCCPRCGHECKA